MLALGAAAVLALLGVDPAVATFLLDADLLVLLGSVGVAMLAADTRVLVARMRTSPAAVLLRTGASMTRSHPVSLIAR